jgi:hypothetical protein
MAVGMVDSSFGVLRTLFQSVTESQVLFGGFQANTVGMGDVITAENIRRLACQPNIRAIELTPSTKGAPKE